MLFNGFLGPSSELTALTRILHHLYIKYYTQYLIEMQNKHQSINYGNNNTHNGSG